MNERPARPNKDHTNYQDRAEQYMDWVDTEIKNRAVRNHQLANRLNDADRRIAELEQRITDLETRNKNLVKALSDSGPIKKIVDKLEATEQRNQELETENAEYKASFDLRWKADMRAIKKWHDAGGDKMMWPDHADLCVWLIDRITERGGR